MRWGIVSGNCELELSCHLWIGRKERANLGQDFAENVQQLADGAVADGVDADGDAGGVGALDGGGDLGHRHDWAGRCRRRDRRHHPGRASAQRSIGKELDPAHAQPVIAKAACAGRVRLRRRATSPAIMHPDP